jgi:uncharacterized protein YndB with AHSA1/START domain
MAVSGSTEFDVDASPEQVMDAVAAVEDLPQRSGAHKSAEVETRHADGRPHRVRAEVSAAGFNDTEVTDYTWDEPRSVTWTLAESSVQSEQVGTYTLTPTDSGTHIRLDLQIGVKVPMPGFILKRVLKSALDTGSKGFKKYVESR